MVNVPGLTIVQENTVLAWQVTRPRVPRLMLARLGLLQGTTLDATLCITFYPTRSKLFTTVSMRAGAPVPVLPMAVSAVVPTLLRALIRRPSGTLGQQCTLAVGMWTPCRWEVYAWSTVTLPTLQALPSRLVRPLMPATLLLLVAIRTVWVASVLNLARGLLAPGPTVRQMMQLRVWLTVLVRLVRTDRTTRKWPLLLVYPSLSAICAAARIPNAPLSMQPRLRLQESPARFLVAMLVLVVLPKTTHLPLAKTRGSSGDRVVTADALPIPPMMVAVMAPGRRSPSALTVTTPPSLGGRPCPEAGE